MHLSLLFVAGLLAVATALPQRPGGGQGQFLGGRPSAQSTQGGRVQPADLSSDQTSQAGTQQGVANDSSLNNQGQASTIDQGDLVNQGTGNVNQNGTIIGNDGQKPNGQDQSGEIQSGQDQKGSDQNGGSQDGADQTTTSFDASLVPEFGIQAGQSPDGQGNCLGLNNVKIPCSCPPDRQGFIQKVQAAAAAGNSEGVPVKFPSDDSSASKKARIQTSIVVLQNLNGRGKGCPAAATTFLAQQAAA
ncbi:hypothetical protein SLS60_000746 [Paraconiothyrium brasiliense]|uniref:Uncharacterized protein n=1 Tax=Paraconiothyrium brasiliense TaxID=300254 RepID=A0ABR3S738_9PLEO